ncbi:MAG: bifunctional diaminohydroxyphosphoribosylaminopyrimidine deaminase/5-amino-6-(5-phosphoribosylamino)uracil reductase RibD [Bacteroidota bacterium]|nr:bifunctional diaminohydroxyphosphoribosylaminopyrimidine deaminase/5-amino-6-(5-phosphoribosylamino)uracil reductase RibD [Bacteroidota bacterium]
MKRAIELALKGLGSVSPNPMVGAVLVVDNQIIGEGYHMKYGGPHAEVHAIESVSDKELLNKSTLYVTLEPCNHFGKTPPCTELIINNQIKNVVIGSVDPNPIVSGKGIKKLEENGISVTKDILEKECQLLNCRFHTFHLQKRPYIILKWAETANGFIANTDYNSKWISNKYSRKLVHKWRSEEDAVLVGFNTAWYDNPQLNVRDWNGRNPIRILLDRHLEIPGNYHLLNQSEKTIIFNTIENDKSNKVEYIKINEWSVNEIVKKLYEHNIQSIIIEGGANTIQKFFDENMWDEARVFQGVTTYDNGIKAPVLKNAKMTNAENIQNDTLTYFQNINGNIRDI